VLLSSVRPARADEDGCLSGARLRTAEQVLEQIRNAREYLQVLDTPVMEGEPTTTERAVKVRVAGKKGELVERTLVRKAKHVALSRRITIAAYDECDGALHTVAVRVPHPLPTLGTVKTPTGTRGAPYFVYTRLTPGYEVSHEGGLGVARLKFSVTKDGRPLTVLAMKHPRIASKYWRSRDPRVLDDAQPVVYSAYQPQYHERPFTNELVMEGVRRWIGDIRGALGMLKQSGARSFAFPDELLAQVWPPEVLLMLGTIEQSDDAEFRDDPRRTAEAVAIEYALNPEPFYFSTSSADAIGPYQFTDNWKGDRPGTYSSLVRKCSDASLDPSFERGARDLRNSLRAAVCLLDLELARMPEDALRLFREDYDLGVTYPVAAYNAGSGQSARLYHALPPDALPDAARSLDLPLKAFQYRKAIARGTKKAVARGVIVNNETRYYLLKMFTTWDIVNDWMARVEVSAATRVSAEDNQRESIQDAITSDSEINREKVRTLGLNPEAMGQPGAQ
jgi:hypothetical protein